MVGDIKIKLIKLQNAVKKPEIDDRNMYICFANGNVIGGQRADSNNGIVV